MTSVTRYEGTRPMARPLGNRGESLADVLERVLDKGVVIAGDVVVNVLDIELLTLKLRLLIASADTAKSMGIDWWEHDPFLNRRARDEQAEQQPLTGQDRAALEQENDQLRQRLDRLESALGSRAESSSAGGTDG